LEPDQRASGAHGARPAAPSTALLDMVYAFELSRAVCVAAELGIADLLFDGPQTVDELAAATGTQPEPLFRLLRALASRGVFEQREDGRFAITALAEQLRRDAPGGSVYEYALYVGLPLVQRPWEELLSTLQTGRPSFERVFEASLFDYLASDAAAGKRFNDAMSSHTTRDALAVVDAYDFQAGKVVDVAGGHGALIEAVVAATAGATGVLFDRPQVIEGARERLGQGAVADRCQLVSGDMFESVPSGGDVYMLKRTLHDWEDDRAAVVLENCRRAMNEGGRILVIEMVVDPGAAGHMAKFYDLMMLVMIGGRERTEAEFERLFASAGLRLIRTIATGSPLSVLEAAAA
jgi:SAM-dependent methyltransferase